MLRTNVYLTEEQVSYLTSLKTLRVSEHIRRAIDGYIQQLKSIKVSSSSSPRKVKNGK
jgi:hypothetical protein